MLPGLPRRTRPTTNDTVDNKPKSEIPMEFLKQVGFMEQYHHPLKEFIRNCFSQCHDDNQKTNVSHNLLLLIREKTGSPGLSMVDWVLTPLVNCNKKESLVSNDKQSKGLSNSHNNSKYQNRDGHNQQKNWNNPREKNNYNKNRNQTPQQDGHNRSSSPQNRNYNQNHQQNQGFPNQQYESNQNNDYNRYNQQQGYNQNSQNYNQQQQNSNQPPPSYNQQQNYPLQQGYDQQPNYNMQPGYNQHQGYNQQPGYNQSPQRYNQPPQDFNQPQGYGAPPPGGYGFQGNYGAPQGYSQHQVHSQSSYPPQMPMNMGYQQQYQPAYQQQMYPPQYSEYMMPPEQYPPYGQPVYQQQPSYIEISGSQNSGPNSQIEQQPAIEIDDLFFGITPAPPARPVKIPINKPVNDSPPVIGRSTDLEKPYLRLTAEADPATVRPLEVLEASLEHCLHKFTETNDYVYLSEQLRSIRQDITVQRIEGPFVLQVHELHSRYAVMFCDWENFTQVQPRLDICYSKGEGKSENEIEMSSYRVLYQVSRGDMTGLSEFLPKMRSDIRNSHDVKFAVRAWRAMKEGDIIKYCKMVDETDQSRKNIMLLGAETMRSKAYTVITASIRETSLTLFKDALGFAHIKDARDWLLDHNLIVPVEE